MKKVFLGGTVDSQWRDILIPLLEIDYFNPLITDRPWVEQDRLNEVSARQTCDYVLYVLTPRMTGLYAIAEAVDDSNKKPSKTILYVIDRDAGEEGTTVTFVKSIKDSLDNISKLVEGNGAKVCRSMQEVANYLNSHS